MMNEAQSKSPSRLHYEADHPTIAFRITAVERDRLKQAAKELETTPSGFMRGLLKTALAQPLRANPPRRLGLILLRPPDKRIRCPACKAVFSIWDVESGARQP